MAATVGVKLSRNDQAFKHYHVQAKRQMQAAGNYLSQRALQQIEDRTDRPSGPKALQCVSPLPRQRRASKDTKMGTAVAANASRSISFKSFGFWPSTDTPSPRFLSPQMAVENLLNLEPRPVKHVILQVSLNRRPIPFLMGKQ